jgi:hypothetical protein
LERSHCDALLVLALIHHLAISNNVLVPNIAKLFSGMTKWLLLEFVPKADSQLVRLLATREDIFTDYNQLGFEETCSRYFFIEQSANVPESEKDSLSNENAPLTGQLNCRYGDTAHV